MSGELGIGRLGQCPFLLLAGQFPDVFLDLGIPFLLMGILSSAAWEYYNQESKGRIMTASYSVNGKSITPEKLREIEITKKDYIDYVEAIKQNATNRYREQGGVPAAHETGKAQGIG